ncbi:MAG: carbohydrate ABC transporter permease [Spirochaetales bacterium]|nr:carbohydrate ABC transporter permease [Spirochaetales bacterium]
MSDRILSKIFSYTVFLLFTVFTIFPLVWLFYSSLKPKAEYLMDQLALPKAWTITNFVDALSVEKTNLVLFMGNSVIYTFSSTLLVILFAMMASFAFSKLPFKKTSAVFYSLFGLGLLITVQALLIPLFLFLRTVGLYDTHAGIILPYVAINLPLAVFLGTTYMRELPDSMIEAAEMDGAGKWLVFLRIIFPMCEPVIVTMGIMTVLACWNEFLFVFIFTASDATRSLPVGIYSFSGETATEYGVQFAALVIGIVPMIITYALFHKRITYGMVAGAIKG